jgi:hypothetical protein
MLMIGYLAQLREVLHETGDVNLRPSPCRSYFVLLVELRRRDIHAEIDLLAELVAGFLDGLDDDLDAGFVRREVRREATFVTDRGRELLPFRMPLSVWKIPAP